MWIKSKKYILSSLLFISISNLPLLAHALVIYDKTNLPSTVKINGVCSGKYPGGVTEPGIPNNVPDGLISALCIGSLHNCVAAIYMTRNCDASGPQIGTAIYDISKGILTANVALPYHVEYNASSIEISYKS